MAITLLLGASVSARLADGAESDRITIANADTQLSLRAGERAPQLLALAAKPGAGWRGSADERLIDHVFDHASDQDQSSPIRWHYDAKASRIAKDAALLVYRTHAPELKLESAWRARAKHGPFEHTIRIENLSGRELWLPLQDSLQLAWQLAPDEALEQVWIDKGAGEAPPIGTHRADVDENYDWHGDSSPFAHPRGNEPREIIPYFFVRAAGADAHRGWYVGIEFSGRVSLSLQRHGSSIEARAGLNGDRGAYRTRLAAGATFATPTIFLGASNGDIDDTGNHLRRWVREVLADPAAIKNAQYPLVVNNSWGGEMQIDETLAKRMIDDAKALGFEMFHIDAGWFRAVGDWYPDAAKFPHGLAAVADYAHAQGMKFGLWADWAQAGTSAQAGALNVADAAVRDWLTVLPPADWKPAQFKGITIDLGVPAAKAWAAREVERMVRDYHLDMLEHDGYVVAQTCEQPDHPHAVIDPHQTRRYSDDEFLWADSTNSTDVSDHATRAYYDIHDQLKRAHPALLLEICNDGGRMVDFGSAAHGDYFSIIDSYDPVSNRQAFYDASHVLPSAMLENYVKEWPATTIGNFRYMLRSGMMGWFTLMIDTNRWNREQHDAARAEIEVYKSRLRALIRNADLYHIAPRADGIGWDGIEYYDARQRKGVIYAFRGKGGKAEKYTFSLRGLAPQQRYRLHFQDGSAPDALHTGKELLHSGVTVTLPMEETSELVFIDAVR